MRTNWFHLEIYRIGGDPMQRYGAFGIPIRFPDGNLNKDWYAQVIASDGEEMPETDGWEHVSVTMRGAKPDLFRTPNWNEMCVIKDLFWNEDETVLQFHPKESKYVNLHPFVLHLWKKSGEDFPLPPMILI